MLTYHEHLLDHFYHPRCVGVFAASAANVGTGRIETADAQTILQLQIQISSQEKIIEQTKFKALGCVSAIAVCSFVAEWLSGKTIYQALDLKCQMLIDRLQIPQQEQYCALLAEEVINAAIANYHHNINIPGDFYANRF